jgi:hypothetical protein
MEETLNPRESMLNWMVCHLIKKHYDVLEHISSRFEEEIFVISSRQDFIFSFLNPEE